jgi:ABC-type sulfate transport system substrate-binding protein
MGTRAKAAYCKILYSPLCIIIAAIKYFRPLNACADDKELAIAARGLLQHWH